MCSCKISNGRARVRERVALMCHLMGMSELMLLLLLRKGGKVCELISARFAEQWCNRRLSQRLSSSFSFFSTISLDATDISRRTMQ